MSDNRVEIKFFHRFSRKSDNGKAFGWLKDNLGSACDDAITSAVRFVYLPFALAAAGATRTEVETSINKASEFLNEKMMTALGSCCEPEENVKAPSNGSSPEIKFFHRFSRKSDNGKAFGWLKDNLGSACDDAITNVVRFVYLPIALAAAGATRTEVETSINKASEFLNEKMMAALGSCCDQEENVKAPSNGSTPVRPRSVHPSEVVLAGTENSNASNGASTSLSAAIDPMDDFLELDEDKFMES